ncbi:cation diffusion facilitator family transporter [Prevotella sp. 885]|uniref:cation diffusion facilitator family transporter n=1 Tax=Prevotella sp. 885 TaxID=2022527 RepID=UPI000BA09E6A|nr:cation diffusion facilitator family transporter [Prevotella sp. 885]OZT03429.1 cation-efflux pump [Prevotella sp. 885]
MDRQKETYRVTIAGSIINILLLAFKFAAGILGHSAAMIADAIHSLTDFVTDAIVLVFVRLGSKPTDRDHDYGHGKYETLASAIIGVSLLVVGMMICYSGVTKTYHAMCGEPLQQPGFIALAAAVASVVLKEWAYRFTVRVGRRCHSEAVVANAWHHRSDALSSVGTTVGIGGAIILGEKWAVLDPLTAIVVSFFIMKAAWSVLSKAVGELTDGSLPKETEDEIEKIVSEDKEVSVVHNLCTRRIGNRIAIEMHVRMPGETSLYVAHHHATEIEQRLKQRFGADTHISIHLEPVKVNGHYEDPAVRQEQPQP